MMAHAVYGTGLPTPDVGRPQDVAGNVGFGLLPGSTEVYVREAGSLETCTGQSCPHSKLEMTLDYTANRTSVTSASTLAWVNRAPYSTNPATLYAQSCQVSDVASNDDAAALNTALTASIVPLFNIREVGWRCFLCG